MSIRMRLFIKRLFMVRPSRPTQVLLRVGLAFWCAAALVAVASLHDSLALDAVRALATYPKYFDLLLSDLGFLVFCAFVIEILTRRQMKQK